MTNRTTKAWRGHSFFIPKPLILQDKYTRWIKITESLGLSKQARIRLEQIIYYEIKEMYNI